MQDKSIQKSDSSREEPVLKSVGTWPHFCIFFPKEEGGRENIRGACVLNYAGCFAEAAGSVDRVNGWEAGLRDGLGYIHNPL